MTRSARGLFATAELLVGSTSSLFLSQIALIYVPRGFALRYINW